MLQQTVVATVIPYYAKFLEAYPGIENLAAAPLDEVLGLWAGLGYYARARNLHGCAQQVAAAGGFPQSIEGLRALPGIGPYTANAIGAIAFNLPVLPVDGNIERIAARIFGVSAAIPAAKPEIARIALRLMQHKAAIAAPGDFAQALFDLGATICTPRSPACVECPWQSACQAHALGIAATLPVRTKKTQRPHRTGVAYVLLDKSGNILLIRRPPSGLLGGMLALPDVPPVKAKWRDVGEIQHVFTHFSLTMQVKVAVVAKLPPGALAAPAKTAPLPSVMRKALDAGLNSIDDCA
ncbi:MAG: A/G-specific adenine glycosylase [Acidocella sp.]|nr:A/G-specific adenine glycosylase [Acidocella sp.]